VVKIINPDASSITHKVALFLQHYSPKTKPMAQDNNNRGREKENELSSRRDKQIGNQQGTTQTGAQNAGGENIDREEDQYTDDLRQSGDRNSSNRKQGS
jgi:hypothetical protein